MSKRDSYLAAERIIMLTKICPHIRFFVTPSISDELLKLVDSGDPVAKEAAERVQPMPRYFSSIIARIAEEKKSPVWRGSLQRTIASVNNVITLRIKAKDRMEELLELMEEIDPKKELSREFLRKIGIDSRGIKHVLANSNKFARGFEQVKDTLRCALKYL